ncbi:hypothetical protein [Salarchaeum japonicum]|uniref:hypothetical protein n=1 Tax=Salarchaeum japonicum TaxID=555573 RepID=UPI003C793BB5
MSIPVPRKASLETLLDIIQGWYSAGAEKESTSNSEVANRVGISNGSISRQNAFLVECNILENDGRGKKLTEAGATYAQALLQEEELAGEQLAPILFEYETTDAFVDFLSIRNPSRSEAVSQLEEITGQEADSDSSLETLLEFYIHSRIVFERDDGKLDAVHEADFETNQGEEKADIPEDSSISSDELIPDEPGYESDTPGASDQRNSAEGSDISVEYSVSISCEISGDENPSQVYRVVRAISEGLNTQASISDGFEEEWSTDTVTDQSKEPDHNASKTNSEPGQSEQSDNHSTDTKSDDIDEELDSYF